MSARLANAIWSARSRYASRLSPESLYRGLREHFSDRDRGILGRAGVTGCAAPDAVIQSWVGRTASATLNGSHRRGSGPYTVIQDCSEGNAIKPAVGEHQRDDRAERKQGVPYPPTLDDCSAVSGSSYISTPMYTELELEWWKAGNTGGGCGERRRHDPRRRRRSMEEIAR